METLKLSEAVTYLKNQEKRKFDQSIDLIVNLKNIDPKKDQLNIIINVAHKIKDKKVCAFLNEKSKIIDTITLTQFSKYSDKKLLKDLVKKYDYFIAVAPLMPKVAITFGKVLGPAGKMPSPQLGIITQENEDSIKSTLEKIDNSIKIRLKEASIKLTIGKESMPEEKIIENIQSVCKAIENALPKKKDNIKSVMLKLTMSKPLRVDV